MISIGIDKQIAGTLTGSDEGLSLLILFALKLLVSDKREEMVDLQLYLRRKVNYKPLLFYLGIQITSDYLI